MYERPCHQCAFFPTKCTPYKNEYHRCIFEDWRFIEAMVFNWIDGAQRPGREPNGWKIIPWDRKTRFKYFKKLMGHAAQAFAAQDITEARKHWAAVACNANILFHHEDH